MPMGEMHIFLYRLGLDFYKIYESKRKGSQVLEKFSTICFLHIQLSLIQNLV